MYLAYYFRQFYLTIRFNFKLKFKVSSERLRQPCNLRTMSGNFACLHSVLGAPFDIQVLRERNKIPMLVTWIKTTKKTPGKGSGNGKGNRNRNKKRKRKLEKGFEKSNRKRKTENKKGKQDTKQKRALKNDGEKEPTDKPEGVKKGYTVNATAAYTLNCVDRHSRVTCQSWHVYVILRPGSQVEWCEKENLWAKRAERGLGRKNRRGGDFPGVNGAWPRWKCMQYVKKGQVPIWIKLFKCCTVGVAVYSALTSLL